MLARRSTRACSKAVSYTHLDVYKRQIGDWVSVSSSLEKSFSCRILEYLFPVPIEECRPREILPGLRQDQSGTLVSQKSVGGLVVTVEMLAEDDLVGFGKHGERTQVEYLVVQRAKRNAIWYHVRPRCLEPFDMGLSLIHI